MYFFEVLIDLGLAETLPICNKVLAELQCSLIVHCLSVFLLVSTLWAQYCVSLCMVVCLVVSTIKWKSLVRMTWNLAW